MRVKSAFHRFTKTEKLPRDGPLKYSLRCMAAQIALEDVVYSKHLHLHLESKNASNVKEMSVKDLAKDLFPAPNMKNTTEVAYVLLFDGMDQLPEGEASQLFEALLAVKSSMVRILMTGTEEISSKKSLVSIPNIQVAEHNKADIRRFVDSELKTCEILQGNEPEALKIKGSIRQKLPEIGNGSFNDVRQIMQVICEAVESEVSEDEIMDLISADTLKQKDTVIPKLLAELNDSLNDREIDQLNELLIWTIYSLKSMSTDEMRAALFLRTKRTPLQSLEAKVELKYSKLLKIVPNNALPDCSALEIKNDDLRNYFRQSKRGKANMDRDDPKISMTITIHRASIPNVQRFLWDLSEKVNFDKFKFKSSQTSPPQNATISANESDGQMTLARRCFELLQDEPKEATKVLGGYALRYLDWHLYVLTHYCHLELTEKGGIVSQLVSLLQSADSIEQHLTKDFFERAYWVDKESDFVDAIYEWLGDSEAAKNLNQKDNRWLTKVASEKQPLALRDIAKMIARQWLCKRTWPAQLPFHWIDVFLGRLEESQEQDQAQDEPQSGEGSKDLPEEEDAITVSDATFAKENLSESGRIQRAADWARNEAGIARNSLWYERLGNTYLKYELWDLAKGEFLEGKKLPNSSLKISEGLAEAYSQSNKKDLAIQEMEIVLSHLKRKDELATEEKADLIRDLVKSANWQTKLRNTADAVIKLREAIRLDEDQYENYYELLSLFIDTEQVPETLGLLKELATHDAKDPSLSRLGAMLLDFADRGVPLEHVERIFHATRDGDMFQVILQHLQSALTFARERQPASIAYLLLYHGVALAHYSTMDKRLESPVEQWRECCKLGLQSEKWKDLYSYYLAAKYIFNFHFSNAKSMQGPSTDCETCVTELRKLTESMGNTYSAYKLRLSLGRYHSLFGTQKVAQDLLMSDMKDGMAFLSDDDPKNDFMGYEIIAQILLHTGDDLNALSAWSLYGPSERYENDEHELEYSCDGRCNKPWTFADSVWFCKVCDDVQFDDECLEKLRKGNLKRDVCSPDHEWLRVPSWVDEYEATGKGRVRVGGELQEGKRVGGQIVAVEEWLDTVRDKWGIEKPAPEIKAEGRKQEDGEQKEGTLNTES